jgi:putative membrane protein
VRRVTLVLLLAAGAAQAHNTGTPHDEPPGWTWDPWITGPLLLAALLFWVGWRRLSARSGRGAASLHRRAMLFAGGLLTASAALVSPLHQAGERSFAAHMFEHELLMLVAAPLFALSAPPAIMLWAFPASGRRLLGTVGASAPMRMAWRTLSAPVNATLLQAAALWLWHAPPLFDRALASDGWHVTQHLSFLVSALLFWSAMLSRRTPAGVAALCLVTTSIVSGALGALMAFATSPWYAGYAALGMAPFGLTPAEDQQVAGLLMWVPGGLVHAGAALVLLRRLLRDTPVEARHAV